MANQNVYVDAGAGTNGDGSIGSPYNAFSSINWSTGGANSITDWVAAGDDVFINLKGTFTSRLNIGASGTADHYITIRGYDTGVTVSVTGAWGMFNSTNGVNDQSYLIIDGITVSQADSKGIYFYGTSSDARYCIVRNCNISNITSATTANGIDFRGSHVTVEDTTINLVDDDCIYGSGDNFTARRCTLTNYSQNERGDGIQTIGDNHLVEYCTISSGTGNIPKQAVILKGTNCVIRYNDLTESTEGRVATSTQANVIYVDGGNHEIYGNKITSGTYGIFPDRLLSTTGVVKIYNNVIKNISFLGISIRVNGGFYIYNNTLTDVYGGTEDSFGHGVRISLNTNNDFYIYNNIFEGTVKGISWFGDGTGTLYRDYNMFYNFTSAPDGTLGSNSTTTTDPLINADGTLQASSPARDAGTTLAGYNDVGRLDPWDNSANDSPNIGADQGSDQNVTSIDTGFAFNEPSYTVRVKN